MNYIVLDLEWNQGERKSSHKEIPFEIIEIGALKLNSEKNIIGEFRQLIKPEVYSKMNHVVKGIVHLHMDELENGKPFVDAMNQFLTWCGEEEYIFCTWGSLDLFELQRNMEYYNMEPLSLGPIAFLDVQKLFSRQYEDKKSVRNLEYAVDFLHIEKNISFHRAYSDAYYTAKILQTLTCEVEAHISFDTFHIPQNKEQEVYAVFDDYAKYISREFKNKVAAFKDKELLSTRCYKCQKLLKKKQRWFSCHARYYYSISYCPEHGYMKGKIRIKKTDKGTVYGIKILKLISEEEKEEIMKKKEEVMQNKRKKSRTRRLKKRTATERMLP